MKWHSIIALSLALVLASCGIPKKDRTRANNSPARYAEATAFVSEKEGQYKKQIEAKEFAFLKKYAERENWSKAFAEAKASADSAKELYDKEIQPVLKRNKSDETSTLNSLVDRFDGRLSEARNKAKSVNERITLLVETRNKAPQLVATAKSQAASVGSIHSSVASRVEKTKRDFPSLASIDQRYAPIRKMATDAQDALAKAEAELAKVGTDLSKVEAEQAKTGKGDPDYAVLADSTKVVGQILDDIQKKGPAFETALGGLYSSYSKTLVDMRTDQFVEIGRTSWDEASDWNTDTDYVYPSRKVENWVYDYYDALPEDTNIAAITWLGFDVSSDSGKWGQLGIDPKEGWPSRSHDRAEYWVSDTPEKYYHKYLIHQDGKESDSGWVEVNPATFDEHEGDLGMTIVSKAAGMFEDEKLVQAVPPGMAYVGNPKYGEWKKDATGNSFWEFYGQWMFFNALLGNNQRYSMTEWDDWRRNYRGQKSYYGEEDKDGYVRYGTYSSTVHSHPRYSKGTYAGQGGLNSARNEVKTYKASGRTPGATVRGAGPSRRGGGPGGGGK